MELDAAQVHDEQRPGIVVDGHVVDHARLRVLGQDLAAADPVGDVRWRRLLVEMRTGDAVWHPLHRERPAGEVRDDELGDVEVVRDQIAIRVALVGPEHLVEVRKPELAALDLEPPGVPVPAGGEGPRHIEREGLRPRAFPARHESMLDAAGELVPAPPDRSKLTVSRARLWRYLMPRAMWKGAISFGLVTIPVAVYPATEEKTLRFNQLHDDDLGRVRYKRVCEKDGEELSFEHIVKGYEYEKDHYVVLTDEDFDAVPLESSRAIDIVQFVHLDEIDPVMYKKSYYLLPEETGAKAYALLREALSQDNRVGIAKVSFRDKEHLAALRFRGDAFVLETMYWPDEIREADFGGIY